MTIRVKLVFLLLIVVSLCVSGCFSILPNSAPAGSSSSGSGNIDTSLFKTDSSASVSESNAELQKIAGYLEAGDINNVNNSLSVNAHALMSGPLKIPVDRAAKVGQAMKKARVTSASMDVVFYVTDIDGESFSFDMAKEGGVWKLDQF
jgi:uncharacterized protein YceK